MRGFSEPHKGALSYLFLFRHTNSTVSYVVQKERSKTYEKKINACGTKITVSKGNKVNQKSNPSSPERIKTITPRRKNEKLQKIMRKPRKTKALK